MNLQVKNILVLLFLVLSTSAFGHDYYFGFAEVEYNEISQKFEATLVMSTHDMEKAIREELNLQARLEEIALHSAESARIEELLNAHFGVRSPKAVSFKLVGCETLSNGITHFYLESDPVEWNWEMDWKFDMLMSQFPEQQNKLTFQYRTAQHTLTFLPTATTQTLTLETNGL